MTPETPDLRALAYRLDTIADRLHNLEVQMRGLRLWPGLNRFFAEPEADETSLADKLIRLRYTLYHPDCKEHPRQEKDRSDDADHDP